MRSLTHVPVFWMTAACAIALAALSLYPADRPMVADLQWPETHFAAAP